MKDILLYLLITLTIAVILAPLASSLPDGLDWTIQRSRIQVQEVPLLHKIAPLPDYAVPGWDDSPFSTSIAGLLGVLLCFFLPFTLVLFRKK
ncbi:MAG: PDGLE domain-containing protein [bacterium]